jgi:hypothetical protein
MRPALSDLLQIVLCNRAASYMALNKPIPALADAQRAAACDPTNWKAHWRTGLSLMMMAPRLERSEQAIAAFERTCACPTLPESEKQNAKEALNRAKYRLEQGKDALDMPDMSSKPPASLRGGHAITSLPTRRSPLFRCCHCLSHTNLCMPFLADCVIA